MSLQMFLLVLLTVRSECVTVGREFIVVFPENIAYYYPSNPDNKVRITALLDSTTVSFSPTSSVVSPSGAGPFSLTSGQTTEYVMATSLELDKSSMSSKTLSIVSNNNISVEILSHRNNSIQTALIFPTSQLGTVYLIPPIPQILKTTTPASQVTTDVTERSPFKLIIVNKNGSNTINLGGNMQLNLQDTQVAQVWVNTSMVGTTISGTKPFLVLFGHSCAMQYDCTCGVLYTPLVPKKTDSLKYYIPPVFEESAENCTYLLKSDGNTEAFEPNSMASFDFTGTVMLQRPGLLINLIPENEFGACFSVQQVIGAESWAIIMVPTDKTSDTQIGKGGVSQTWNNIPGTSYSYTKFPLSSPGKYFIWHKSAKIAVWFAGRQVTDKNAWFGNPASLIAQDPDYRGCALTSQVLEFPQDVGSWQESIQSCKSRNLTLISLSDQTLQGQVYTQIRNQAENLTELWIGLRRSSYTGEWYWINNDQVGDVDWEHGEPGDSDDGQCALLNMNNGANPGWTDEDCCKKARPVCYRPPKLLNMI